MPPEKKGLVMSVVSSVVELILRTTRDYGVQRPTKEKTPLPLKQYTPHAQAKHTLYTQPRVTYAQITK
jgi:hypothetical protein